MSRFFTRIKQKTPTKRHTDSKRDAFRFTLLLYRL